MKEIWKDIKGHENHQNISKYRNAKSFLDTDK